MQPNAIEYRAQYAAAAFAYGLKYRKTIWPMLLHTVKRLVLATFPGKDKDPCLSCKGR